MGNATGVLLAGRVLTFMGLFFGPLFPIIGQFMLDGVKSWIAWVLILIIILFFALPMGLAASEFRRQAIEGEPMPTAGMSGAMIAFLILLVAYIAILIYACYHAMAHFRVVGDQIVHVGAGNTLLPPTSVTPPGASVTNAIAAPGALTPP